MPIKSLFCVLILLSSDSFAASGRPPLRPGWRYQKQPKRTHVSFFELAWSKQEIKACVACKSEIERMCNRFKLATPKSTLEYAVSNKHMQTIGLGPAIYHGEEAHAYDYLCRNKGCHFHELAIPKLKRFGLIK